MKELFSISDTRTIAKCFRDQQDIKIVLYRRTRKGFAPMAFRTDFVDVSSVPRENVMEVLRLQAHLLLTTA